MQLLRLLFASWRARRAAEAESDIRSWHEACQTVLAACVWALQEPGSSQTDIGVTLDRIDRELFRLRDAGSGARHVLRRRDAGLRSRLGRVSEAIIELRNETARFLIRAQGPTPSFLQKQGTGPGQSDAYRRAWQDVGQAALDRSVDITLDLRRVWADLQPVLAQLASSAAGK